MLSFKEEEVRQACFLLPPPGGAPRDVRGVTRDGVPSTLTHRSIQRPFPPARMT